MTAALTVPTADNLALPAARAVFDAINTKDLARIPELVTDDFVDHGSPFPLPPGPDGYTQILTFVTRVLDFGGLSVGDPTVDLVVAWEVLDPPARELFRRQIGVDEASWLRGRAWALSITLMIWYYWTTMPKRRARCMAVGRNVLADAGYSV